MPRPKKGQKTPGSGRKKGTPNKVTRVFAELVDESLFGDPKLTLKRLNELRDSDESQDRSTYWRVVGKRLPQLHEAKIESARTLVRFSFDGITREASDDDGQGGQDPDR